MVEEKEKLIQMPDSLLENPPEPRRKDIADLFAQIVSDEKSKKGSKKRKKNNIFYLDFSNDEYVEISSKSALLGTLSRQKFEMYSITKKIYWYMYNKKNSIKIKSPYNSKFLKKILNWIGIKKAKKIIIKLEKNKNLLKLEYY